MRQSIVVDQVNRKSTQQPRLHQAPSLLLRPQDLQRVLPRELSQEARQTPQELKQALRLLRADH